MRMLKPANWNILEPKLIRACDDMARKVHHCCDSFNDYDWDKVREQLGSSFAHIPLSDIRTLSISLRKSHRLSRVNGGHGPPPAEYKHSPEYLARIASSEWTEFCKKIKGLWHDRCAICYARVALQVHHRTYVRLGHELKTDVLPLCRNCHASADKRRAWSSDKSSVKELF